MGGTLAYTAPEVLLYKKTTFKADVFSFGVLLHEICSGEAPNRRRTLSSQLRRGGLRVDALSSFLFPCTAGWGLRVRRCTNCTRSCAHPPTSALTHMRRAPREVVDLFHACIRSDPDERPSAEEVVAVLEAAPATLALTY